MKKKFKKIGLALGGGGGKGAYHVGLFKALQESNLTNKIVAISGTSVGSLNAALFVQGDLDLATYIWRCEIEKEILYFDQASFKDNWNFLKNLVHLDFKKREFGNLLEQSKMKGAIFSRKGLSNILEEYLLLNYTEQKTINIYATCTQQDLRTADYFNLTTLPSRAEIIKVLLASSAIPAVFGHEKIGEMLYVDGGVVDNLPIKPLYDEGCDLIITAPLWRSNRVKPELFPNCHFIELVPETDLGGVAGVFNFSPKNSRMLMEQAYQEHGALLATLPKIFQLD